MMNYQKLGFRCGLEIHQQLKGTKLFCNCPAVISRDREDYAVKRMLRASAGETGAVDTAALHEMSKQKTFTYLGYQDHTCLVETDSEPPHSVNSDALRIALTVARALHCDIVDEIQFMRKVVVDGSNTSAFQRTALAGRNGYINVDGKRTGVPTLCLEEEACQLMKRTARHDVYNLTRLGIPLLEIATDASITSPDECRKTAGAIGMVLRSVPGMKRGIGTIRQDVNISIRGGARTEIKGFQNYKAIPKVIEFEINRQLELIKKGKKVNEEVRKAEPDFTTSFLRPMPGAARMYPETDVPTIRPDTSGVAEVQLIDEKAAAWGKRHGIDKNLSMKLIRQGIDMDSLSRQYKNIRPTFFAEYFIAYPKELRKRYDVDIDVNKHSDELFGKLDAGIIPRDAVIGILAELGRGKKVDFSKYAGMSDSEAEKIIREIVEQNKGAPMGALMGLVMEKLRGKVDGKRVSEMVNKAAGRSRMQEGVICGRTKGRLKGD